MLRYLLIAIGMVGPFFMIRYRERLGDMVGEAEWMKKLGGVYMVIVIVALIIFFWSLAELTGTTSLLFTPVKYLFPTAQSLPRASP